MGQRFLHLLITPMAVLLFCPNAFSQDQVCRVLFTDFQTEYGRHGVTVNYVTELELTRLRAEKALRRPISEKLLNRIFEAHLVGVGEPGVDDVNPAGPGNFTAKQLRAKYMILRKSEEPENELAQSEIQELFASSVVGVRLVARTPDEKSNSMRDLIARNANDIDIIAAYTREHRELEAQVAENVEGVLNALSRLNRDYRLYLSATKPKGRRMTADGRYWIDSNYVAHEVVPWPALLQQLRSGE